MLLCSLLWNFILKNKGRSIHISVDIIPSQTYSILCLAVLFIFLLCTLFPAMCLFFVFFLFFVFCTVLNDCRIFFLLSVKLISSRHIFCVHFLMWGYCFSFSVMKSSWTVSLQTEGNFMFYFFICFLSYVLFLLLFICTAWFLLLDSNYMKWHHRWKKLIE